MLASTLKLFRIENNIQRQKRGTGGRAAFHFAKGSVYLNFSRRDSVEWETEMLFYGECGWCAAHGTRLGNFGETKKRQQNNGKKVNIYLFTSAFIFCCRYCFSKRRFPLTDQVYSFRFRPWRICLTLTASEHNIVGSQDLQNLMGCLFSYILPYV